MLRETLEDLHRSPSAEKHLRIVLAMEAREGLNTRDKVESLPVATGHLFEGTMGTYHHRVLLIIQHPVGFPTALEEICSCVSAARPEQCVQDGRRY